MKIPVVIAGMAAAGLLAGGVLVLAAEAETTSTTSTPSTTAPLRTVTVQGVAEAPVEQGASAEAATAAYHQAMSAAIADGKAKAQLLAEKAGATLAQVQSINEQGGYVECAVGVEYLGARPDIGYVEGRVFAATAAPAARAPSGHRVGAKTHRTHRGGSAHKAAAESCTVAAKVALDYQLG